MDNIFDYFYKWINELTGTQWAAKVITAVVIIICTILFTYIVTKLMRKLLTKDNVPLPSMSIYINIGRFFCWLFGISILFATCFGVDITGFVAALGVGGIAISLGLKDTISNLISGVQVTSCKIMQPGDHIQVGTTTGIVQDTTWRHTTIKNMYGEIVIVPNSIINSNAVVRLKPFKHIRVHIQLHSKSEALHDVSQKIINEVRSGIKKYGALEEDVKIQFSSIADGGAKGLVSFTMLNDIDGLTATAIKDNVIKLIAPYVEAAKN